MFNSYPEPPPFSWAPLPARPLLPIYPPPPPFDFPSLPSPARIPRIPSPWALSTHLIPACYLRTTRMIPEVDIPAHDSIPKSERAERLDQLRRGMDDVRTDGSWTNDGYPAVLWNCVNRYVRRDVHAGKGVTLFITHACGFPKEIFEPMLAELFSRSGADLVGEVWSWESVQHGDAALVNAGKLSGIFDWHDNVRDMLNFLLHFLPSEPTYHALPCHLPRVSSDESEKRRHRGFASRKLVAVGHSYGGCCSAKAAAYIPLLFSALYLIDPVILQPPLSPSRGRVDPYPITLGKQPDLAYGALARRAEWASRDAARAHFSASPFFSVWDTRVLDVYLECALYDDGDSVRLKTPPTQEAAVFAATITERGAWDALSTLPLSIALRWAMPGRDGAPNLGGPGEAGRRVWVRRERAGNVKISNGGHLIPQEAPGELADDLSQFLIQQFGPDGEDDRVRTAHRAHL